MDLLHSGSVDGFCLVSSDSDFTRLATRIREAGLAVYGFGESKTPKPFVAACDKFILTEILRDPGPEMVQAEPAQEPLQAILLPAIAAAVREGGWAALSAVGNLATKSHPSFDSRNYGFQKLSELIRKQKFLEVKAVPSSDGSPNVHYYVRVKEL